MTKREVMGVVYTRAGSGSPAEFLSTRGVWGKEDRIKGFWWDVYRSMPADAIVVAVWHTHGRYDPSIDFVDRGKPNGNEYLSRSDIEDVAHKLPLPFGLKGAIEAMYLGTPAGRIREYVVGSFVTGVRLLAVPYNELGYFGAFEGAKKPIVPPAKSRDDGPGEQLFPAGVRSK